MDFLREMAGESTKRSEEARAREPEGALRRRALEASPPPPLVLHSSGFDLLGEIKLRSPSLGSLTPHGQGGKPRVRRQAAAYARAGVAAVSVLTEPTRFGGRLDHLRAAAEEIEVPVLRKDFLVDPYQVFEARAQGAGGVLLIARLLEGSRLEELLGAAREARLFVLLEAFDDLDLQRIAEALERRTSEQNLLVGLNSRDLATLEVDRSRLESLAKQFPPGCPRVAESGLESTRDVAWVAGLGYDLALVGSALMRSADPASSLGEMLAAGRRERELKCESA